MKKELIILVILFALAGCTDDPATEPTTEPVTEFILPNDIEFSIFEIEKDIELTNIGTTSINYTIENFNEYIDVYSDMGEILEGEKRSIKVKVNRDILDKSEYSTKQKYL